MHLTKQSLSIWHNNYEIASDAWSDMSLMLLAMTAYSVIASEADEVQHIFDCVYKTNGFMQSKMLTNLALSSA
ncbi:MAG: hypothetical protein ACYDDB_02310 [bacterium]